MANNTTVSTDFFSTASRMSIAQIVKFFKDVVFKMDPRDVPPILLAGAPGIGKSEVLTQLFASHPKGLKTVIASQISPVDSFGLANIEEIKTETGTFNETRFTPTSCFGRGNYNLFLDEINNASPAMLAAIMNLMSARLMGGDSFKDVLIVAAINPPSTNSLSMDLPAPIMNRCLTIVVDYTLDDFINYATNTGNIHVAVTSFLKKTSGSYLQANWEVNKNHGYSTAEPSANSPFCSPRSWEKVSNFLNTMSKTGGIEYSLLQPIISGLVGSEGASAFATTYAYMNRLPDIEAVFDGKLKASEVNIKGEVVIEYLATFAVNNLINSKINEAKLKGIKCTINSTTKAPTKGSPAWTLLAGMHRCIQFINDSCSPELSHMVIGAATQKLDAVLSGGFSSAFFGDIDVEEGLTRAKTLRNIAAKVCDSNQAVAKAFGN